jgi:hypothetical protein
MIKRRAKATILPYSTCCHSFRAPGIYIRVAAAIERMLSGYETNDKFLHAARELISRATSEQDPLDRIPPRDDDGG